MKRITDSIKQNKARINYWIDVVIGIAFVAAAISGLVLFFAGPSGGYRGGRNPEYFRGILGLTRDMWKNVHNWSGIAMTLGVVGHLVFHTNWIVCMTKRIFGRKERSRIRREEVCAVER